MSSDYDENYSLAEVSKFNMNVVTLSEEMNEIGAYFYRVLKRGMTQNEIKKLLKRADKALVDFDSLRKTTKPGSGREEEILGCYNDVEYIKSNYEKVTQKLT